MAYRNQPYPVLPESFAASPDSTSYIEAIPLPYSCVDEFLSQNKDYDVSAPALSELRKYVQDINGLQQPLKSDVITDDVILTSIQNLGPPQSRQDDQELNHIQTYMPGYYYEIDKEGQEKKELIRGELKKIYAQFK
ncbi:hypothetical protein SS50377_26489 [Spironucleus salmonicida]|uniref:Uncharacterized protein n=1 Tax=Spironucleus salmonicida TaxID=348837 RepID=V6LKY8_9EUKA|nr:hypothetical protein SS50377_26489 [Spironucleus salmonicida]|eukprot:EST41344.1 Hypothetical protein SS50377_19058 [Spironucleus salmonicida]